MNSFQELGACDCHSHVFGPFSKFPLSETRTFDPPESPITELTKVWASLAIQRAVLVQGSAHGKDPSALLDAILLSPATRRGVVLLDSNVTEQKLTFLNTRGVRAIRFNWIRHLLGSDTRTQKRRLLDAAELIQRIAPFHWHVEVHIDIDDIDLAENIPVPRDMPIVIDHMARIDMTNPDAKTQLNRLLRLLQNDRFWVKVSGADRLAAKSQDLPIALEAMQAVFKHAPDRCVWGLDWPHVNLNQKRADSELVGLLHEAVGDEGTLRKVLVTNPAKLYGFDVAKD